jgi:hypothetical protein
MNLINRASGLGIFGISLLKFSIYTAIQKLTQNHSLFEGGGFRTQIDQMSSYIFLFHANTFLSAGCKKSETLPGADSIIRARFYTSADFN